MYSFTSNKINRCAMAVIAAVAFGVASEAGARTIAVNTTADVVDPLDGFCTLREAITATNTNAPSGPAIVGGECPAGDPYPTRDRIVFELAECAVIQVAPALGDLPGLSDGGLTIDGWSVPGWSLGDPPPVVIDVNQQTNGLAVNSQKNLVRGLVIGNAAQQAIEIAGANATSNWIYGNHLGVDCSGAATMPNGMYGVYVTTTRNLIGTNGNGQRDVFERNVIGGNYVGIYISGASATGNVVAGNFIGTDASGLQSLGNETGVMIGGGASQNLIGTNGDGNADAEERNLISGNDSDGVSVISDGTVDNRITGNYVGTDVSGTAALPNGTFGIYLGSLSAATIVGTDGSGNAFDVNERNVISGNTLDGIRVNHTSGSVIAGNYIGITAAGQAALGNGVSGIYSLEPSNNNLIGTDGDGVSDAEEANIISGHQYYGIVLNGQDEVVAGNIIGLDSTASLPIPNGQGVIAGIGALQTGARVTIGGKGAVYRNIISGNNGTGVSVSQPDANVYCNYVGTDVTGGLAVGNVSVGIFVQAANMSVAGNTIVYNGSGGISGGDDTSFIRGNSIVDNTDGFVADSGGFMIDATQNWWGAATGPTHAGNPGGTGDTVVDGLSTVNYTPWLAAAPTLCQ